MVRRELGGGVWYDGELKGYAMLDVTAEIPPLMSTEVDGVLVYPKDEFHMSVANLRALAYENPAMEQAMVCFLKEYLTHRPDELRWEGLTGVC